MARHFYADDETTVTKPGFNDKISDKLKEQEGPHGNISFIEGMGVRTVPILEKYSNRARLFLHDKLQIYLAELGTQTSALANEWQLLKGHVNSIITEPVLPGLIYILTASLTGSILVNRRSLPLRFITPLAFGGVAFKYALPQLYLNTKAKLEAAEKDNFPEVYQQQVELKQQAQQLSNQADAALEDANVQLQSFVHRAKAVIVDLFEE